MQPSVTIGIITCNRLEYLKQAIASAEQQGDVVREIIVVNDGSTDGTREYLAKLNNPKIRNISFETNCGRPAARNAVVQAMSGDALLWLDDDDGLAPGAVKSQLQCLNDNAKAEIIYLNHVQCDEHLQLEHETPSASCEPGQMLMKLVFENIIPNGGTLIRRSTFDRIGGYDESYPRAQDYHFWVRAAIADSVFVHNNKPLYYFRRHKNNLANPEVVADQSSYHCKILSQMLEQAPIEKIFPVLNWQADPKGSAAQALLIVAKVFFDHGDDTAALDCIEQAEEFLSTTRGKLMRAYVLRAVNRTAEAADSFAAAIGELEPALQSMNVVVGAPRGSAAVAAQARTARQSGT